jgi:uncharacterized lipoprotein YddW (UPF0748 family)
MRGGSAAAAFAMVVASCRGSTVVMPAAAPAAVSGGSAPTPAKAPASRPAPVVSDVAPPLPREFRGVWVASVGNMDWPSRRTLTTAEQQAELLALLDRAAALKLNAVIFQVRPAADALYASRLEPWSEYLTGTQGKKPDPYWDPLEFAVREAHARHLELHAWFNPYRARFTGAKSPLAPSHIANTNPALVKRYGGYLWMDPGEPAVRHRTLRVVMDVVRRYDIDGVHIDDYFYPYPETDRRGRPLPFPDTRSWTRYRAEGGALPRDDWRRRNVDLLVQALHDSIHVAKPWVRFGISPFGIWRPGFPEQIRGFDAYAQLFADARKWLREGWLDYFTPQLYWPTTKAQQAYPVLLDWWAGENVHDRHLWPGNFTSRAGATGSGAFPVSELVEQIRVTRDQPRATGNVHFSMKSFLTNQARMNDTLVNGPYASLALPPATPWLKVPPPPVPTVAATSDGGGWQVQLSTRGRSAPWQWAVRLRTDTAWITMLLPGTASRWTTPKGMAASVLTVTALNRVGSESPPVTVSLESSSTSPTTGTRRSNGR